MKKIELTEKEKDMMKAIKNTLTNPDRYWPVLLSLVVISSWISSYVIHDYARIHAIDDRLVLTHPIELMEYVNKLSFILFAASWITFLIILIITMGLIIFTLGIAFIVARVAIPAVLKWLIALVILTVKLVAIGAQNILPQRKTPPE